MNDKRLAANRNNARKSTGPRTSRGKAVSSRNALKHGVLAIAPILPGIESRVDWQEHRDGFFKDLSPVGYVEEFLTNRLAVISWRQLRVIRFETKVAAAAMAKAEIDLEERDENGKPTEPEDEREEGYRASLTLQTPNALPEMEDQVHIDKEPAESTFWALFSQMHGDRARPPIPGIPDDDSEFDAFDNWTAGLLRKSGEVFAEIEGIPFEMLLHKCFRTARMKCRGAEREENVFLEKTRRWKLNLEQEVSRRILLEPSVLGMIGRYDGDSDRSFFRTLHELQRLQAARSGEVVPVPAAIDVDVILQEVDYSKSACDHRAQEEPNGERVEQPPDSGPAGNVPDAEPLEKGEIFEDESQG